MMVRSRTVRVLLLPFLITAGVALAVTVAVDIRRARGFVFDLQCVLVIVLACKWRFSRWVDIHNLA